MGRISKGLSGIAGEYFVAGELSRRGYIATLTLRNTRGVDLLVAGRDASVSVGIQVKTNQDSQRSWVLSKKAESLSEAGLFYVFVNLNGLNGTPTYHIVPSDHVANCCGRSHSDWLSRPGRDGRVRQDSNLRKFEDTDGDWLDKWEILGLVNAE